MRKSTCRLLMILALLVGTSFAGVTVSSPGSGWHVGSPVHFVANSTSTNPVVAMAIYVDHFLLYKVSAASINVYLPVAPGNHFVVVQSWDSSGLVTKTPLYNVGVGGGLSYKNLVLSTPFLAGATHTNGRYGFSQNNFLLEGSQRIKNFGAPAIFIYLTSGYASRYPDKTAGLWPSTAPTSLTALAQTAPYRAVFNMFNTIVITAYTFSNNDNVAGFATNPAMATAERQEFYNLTRYLLSTYAGTGKTFILKHWEGDWIGLPTHNASSNISSTMVSAMITWLTARQQGISDARRDAGNPAGVAVLHAVEVNRVLDYAYYGLTRVINAVVPVVKPDMVTYSSYDATISQSTASATVSAMNTALNTIKRLAPDPLGLGNKRILISEYGLFENEHPSDTIWRSQTILSTAKSAGLLGAFAWEIYDNECKQPDGSYFPVDASWGGLRATASQCRGLWLTRPDGSTSSIVSVLTPYWAAAIK